MLTVVSGPFHPGLEKAFLDRIAELKKDPFAPVAVVAPSSRMVERLQLALGASYLNIRFHTFSSLAQGIVDAEAPLKKPILSDPLFFDTLVKQIVRDEKPFEGFEEVAVPDGFPPAVRGTLRDLLDAGINQENVDALIQEGFAGTDVDLGSLRSLLNLHRLYLRRVEKLPVFPRAALLNQAIKIAPRSTFLKKFKEVVYYGFYDLTGLQADLFQSVVKNFPSRFYFPFVHNHPAYEFAKHFWDVFVQPVKAEEIVLGKPLTPTLSLKGEGVKILNVSGLRDEAWYVAGEIRRLHDEQGTPFSEIAVVARTRERLGFLLEAALADRGIPYRSSHFPNKLMFPEPQETLKKLEALKPAREKSTWASFSKESGVEDLEDFDLLDKPVTWKEFIDTLRDSWSRAEVRAGDSSEEGVALLYAEASRGLPFKAVFLIGLEEKVFPRIVREDPFLRDDAREALNGIGHKISKKMTALEEERLLFELIHSSASERLYLLYQRSDDAGGVVGASPFLRAYAEENGIDLDERVESLPRPLLAKIKTADPATLGSSDVMVGFLAAGKTAEAARLVELTGRDKNLLEQGLKLQTAIHGFQEAGPYDGVLGPMGTADVFWKGKISATALEVYGQCGFKYFASRMLGVAPLETADPEEILDAGIRGEKVHQFVHAYFQRRSENKAVEFDSLFDEFFPEHVPAEAKIPALLWDATRAVLRVLLKAFLANELEALKAGGATPVYFEEEVEGKLPPPLDGFVWTGKIDRIDIKGTSADIIDYKTGAPFPKKTVSLMAEKGEKLQAPLYLALAGPFLEKMGRRAADLSFRYEFVEHPGTTRELDAEEWKLKSKAINDAVRALVDAAHAGNFVIKPGWYCDYCPVVRVCRKNHGISVYRARLRLNDGYGGQARS